MTIPSSVNSQNLLTGKQLRRVLQSVQTVQSATKTNNLRQISGVSWYTTKREKGRSIPRNESGLTCPKNACINATFHPNAMRRRCSSLPRSTYGSLNHVTALAFQGLPDKYHDLIVALSMLMKRGRRNLFSDHCRCRSNIDNGQSVVEVMDSMMVEVMQSNTPADRLEIAFRM